MPGTVPTRNSGLFFLVRFVEHKMVDNGDDDGEDDDRRHTLYQATSEHLPQSAYNALFLQVKKLATVTTNQR